MNTKKIYYCFSRAFLVMMCFFGIMSDKIFFPFSYRIVTFTILFILYAIYDVMFQSEAKKDISQSNETKNLKKESSE